MGDEVNSAAFTEGYEAYENGDEIWQNAYVDSTNPVEAGDWREGWLAAAEDYVREAESNEMDKMLDDPRRGQAKSINRGNY